MSEFRSAPRIVLTPPERGGGSSTSQDFAALNFNLNKELIDSDLTPVLYGARQEFMEVVAYHAGIAELRKEQIVIDNGGSWIPLKNPFTAEIFASLVGGTDRAQAFEYWFRAQKNMGRVLTVTIREGQTENKPLADLVERTFASAGLDLNECRLWPNLDSSAENRFNPNDAVFAVTIDCEELSEDESKELHSDAPNPYTPKLEPVGSR